MTVLYGFPSYSLKLGLNENNGYRAPMNAGQLGNKFLYLGFVPEAVPRVPGTTIEGLTVSWS